MQRQLPAPRADAAPYAKPDRRRLATLRAELVRAAGADDERARDIGAKVRGHLEALGSSWREFAVFLASRYDVFSLPFIEEIETIAIWQAPVGMDAVERVFAEDFSRPLDTVLADFDPQPLWSGGLAQMHEATLRLTGEPVWVQVQRPDAAEHVAADVAALDTLCTAFQTAGALKQIPWPRVQRELKSRLTNHLDYRFTAYQLAKLWARWRRYPGAHAPRVHRRRCSRRVIITERIDGIQLAQVLAEQRANPTGVGVWLEANDIEPKRLARRLYQAFLRDLIEDGTCLSDINPARILLLRDSHFAIVPTPLAPIVQLEHDRVRAFRGLVRHLPARAYSSAYTDLLALTEPLPQIDPMELRKYMTRELRAWGQRDAVRTLPPAERSLSALFIAISDLFRERRVVFDVNVAAAVRALRTMESTVTTLHPGLRRIALLQKFFVRSVQRIAKASTRMQEKLSSLTGPAQLDSDAPYDMIDQTERYAESVSEQSLQFVNTASKPAYLFERFFAACRFLTVLGGIAIVLLFVDQEIVRMDALRGDRAGRFLTMAPTLTVLDFSVWGIADAWLFTLFHRITLRFRARDSALPRHGVV